MKKKMKKREFKYLPEDFGTLCVKVLHMDLTFDIFDEYTTVTSHFKAKSLKRLTILEMNAKNLDIHAVSCEQSALTFEYQKEENRLVITFIKPIHKNTEFTIITKTTCRPTKNILEGIYYDETPKGAPPTQITQCQQWGFQRLAPCIDDMTAKCTYRTTIIADKRYTNIITNGDPVTKRTRASKGRVTITYENMKTPMSTYLFFLGVGTYTTFTREFEYPNGDTFTLELLAPVKSQKEAARKALDILYEAIMWIHVFTGPKRYEKLDIKKEIWQLVKERELRKNQRKNIKNIRDKLKSFSKPLTLGYTYTGKIYREIAMQNSDFGGMENVGNTTITANRLMPYKEITDGSFEYMISVKLHEFYHNLNGSEVTGWSPFEIWLNEAVTVHIEREYSAFLFGESYNRLGEVLGLLAPGGGTLMQDVGVASMPIEPDGFNDCNELITGITYVKAPEFVRMIQTLLGKKKFNTGLYSYYKEFKHSNASRAQWIESMEKSSTIPLTSMAKTWLKKTGYPIVKITTKQIGKSLQVTLTQTNGKWEFPFKLAVFNKSGALLNHSTEHIKTKIHVIKFNNISPAEFGFLSVNREYSMYGKVEYTQTNDELLRQVRFDSDIVGRYLAWYKLTDIEKLRLYKDPKAELNPHLVELYFELLSDKDLMSEVGAQFLAIFDSLEVRKYAHHYTKLHNVKKKILVAVAHRYKDQLIKMYAHYAKQRSVGSYIDTQVANIKNRQLQNLCLSLLSYLDTSSIHRIIKHQFVHARTATDKVTAFRLYINSTAKDKLTLLHSYEKEAARNLVSWESFLYCVGSNDSDDAIQIMQRIENSAQFRIDQSNDQRALYGAFARNMKKSLETARGRAYLKKIIIKLASVNEYTTGGILKVTGHVDEMEEQHQIPLIHVLVQILATLTLKKTPSVYNTLRRILQGLPKSRKRYEKKYGKIKGL
jgi:aminopeptidase N